MEQVALNVTSSITSFANAGQVGWLVTAIVFIGICVTIFLVSRNFRRLIYGLPITIGGIIIYKVSRYVGVSTASKDYIPVTWLGYIIGFIFVSIVAGVIVSKSKRVQEWEKSLEEEDEHSKN